MDPGSPFGASVQAPATYYRYTHAMSYERLSRMFDDLYNLPISEGALDNLFQSEKTASMIALRKSSNGFEAVA